MLSQSEEKRFFDLIRHLTNKNEHEATNAFHLFWALAQKHDTDLDELYAAKFSINELIENDGWYWRIKHWLESQPDAKYHAVSTILRNACGLERGNTSAYQRLSLIMMKLKWHPTNSFRNAEGKRARGYIRAK